MTAVCTIIEGIIPWLPTHLCICESLVWRHRDVEVGERMTALVGLQLRGQRQHKYI